MRYLSFAIILILSISILIGGCANNSSGDKFIGKWIGTSILDGTPMHLEISTKDNKTYYLNMTNSKGKKLASEAAILKEEGYLEINQFERLLPNSEGEIDFRSTKFKKENSK